MPSPTFSSSDLYSELAKFARDDLPAALSQALRHDEVVEAFTHIVEQATGFHQHRYSGAGVASQQYWPSAHTLASLGTSELPTNFLPALSPSNWQPANTLGSLGASELPASNLPAASYNLPAASYNLQTSYALASASYDCIDGIGPRLPSNVGVIPGQAHAHQEANSPTRVTRGSDCSTVVIDEGSGFADDRIFVSHVNTILHHHPKRFEARLTTHAHGRKSLSPGHKIESSHEFAIHSYESMRRSVSCCNMLLRRFVLSGYIDFPIAIAIVLNAISLGAQSEHMVVNHTEKDPALLRVFDVVFCVIFTTELIVRIVAHGSKFLHPSTSGWQWHWFDLCVVLLQLLEEMMAFIEAVADDTSKGGEAAITVSMTRILRILRLTRIVRLARVLHLVMELRTLVISLFSCVRSLGWTLVLLFMLIYMLSVFIVQSVASAVLADPSSEKYDTLLYYFGSLGSSVLTLFMSITGGVTWGEVLRPLREYVSPFVVPVFTFYIGFSLLALFNIVTGVFVETAMASARKDKDLYMLHHVCDMFASTDENDDGEISEDEFMNALEHEDMKTYLNDVGLSAEEMVTLFKIIDADGDGKVTPGDFLNGCLRVRGTAQAYEQALIAYELKVQSSDLHELKKRLAATSSMLSSRMAQLSKEVHGLIVLQTRLAVTPRVGNHARPKPQKPNG